MTADECHVRPQGRAGVISAVVRTWAGIYELTITPDGESRCSCGAPNDCPHRAAVELELAGTDEAADR